MTSRFETDTAVVADGPGRWRARIDRGWWIERGPNGGYVAAILLRAIETELADPERRPRSLTVHYLAPPVEGPVVVDTVVERHGRSLSTITARLVQDGATKAIALAACSRDRTGPEWSDLARPDVPPFDRLPSVPPGGHLAPPIPMAERYEQRWAMGQPLAGGSKAESGGWIRLADPTPLDACVVAALTDAWMPAAFNRVTAPIGVPTVDLTVHFRQPPGPGDTRREWCFVRFVTRVSSGGFLEEDGEVWSVDGRLLAQSRQLAAILPVVG